MDDWNKLNLANILIYRIFSHSFFSVSITFFCGGFFFFFFCLLPLRFPLQFLCIFLLFFNCIKTIEDIVPDSETLVTEILGIFL